MELDLRNRVLFNILQQMIDSYGTNPDGDTIPRAIDDINHLFQTEKEEQST